MVLAKNFQPKIFIQLLINAKKAYEKPNRPVDEIYDINDDGTGGDDVYYTDDPEFIRSNKRCNKACHSFVILSRCCWCSRI